MVLLLAANTLKSICQHVKQYKVLPYLCPTDNILYLSIHISMAKSKHQILKHMQNKESFLISR